MTLAHKPILQTWSADHSAMVLGDIFLSNISIAIWQRETQPILAEYFDAVFSNLGLGINRVFEMQSLKASLSETLPKAEGREYAINDIYLLADMLTCLFDCDSVGLRLVPLKKAMCPKFHVDNIPVRLVCTYLGSGTEWLPIEARYPAKPDSLSDAINENAESNYSKKDIQCLRQHEVGLLKGKAWEGHEHLAALHRSCQIADSHKRVLLTLDPM